MDSHQVNELIEKGRLFEGVFQDGDFYMSANIWVIDNKPVVIEPFASLLGGEKSYFEQRVFVVQYPNDYEFSINNEIIDEQKQNLLQETLSALEWRGIKKYNKKIQEVENEYERKKEIKESLDKLFEDFWDEI